MFAKWFGTRSPRSSAKEYHFRPTLEYLEGRLAPSHMGLGGDNGNGNGNGHGNGNDDNGGGPPGHVNNHENIHINEHDNFNIHENNPINIVIGNLGVNQSFGLLGTSSSVLGQELGILLSQSLTGTSGVNLNNVVNLVSSEFQLGQETGTLLTDIFKNDTAGINNLIPQIQQLEQAIQMNPLEATAAGALAGNIAFNLGLQSSLPQLQHT